MTTEAQTPVLTEAQIERFIEDGFVRLDGAFSSEVAAECRKVLWRKTGCDPRDRATWTRPVVRIEHFDDPALQEAADSRILKGAYDQLVGVGRWHFQGFGTFPIRFPVPGEPGDDGWHFDGSYDDDEHRTWVNLATGAAGAVYLCHPFLVHAAQKHRGSEPKFMSQPPLGLREPLRPDRPDAQLSPVERAIRDALRRRQPVRPQA